MKRPTAHRRFLNPTPHDALALVFILALSGVAVGATPGDVCGPVRSLALSSPEATGSDVRELQERLNELGYGPLRLDGVYGKSTEAAVRSFQLAQGLTADGVVGPATWQALSPPSLPAAQGPNQKPTGDMKIVVDTNTLELTLYVDGKPYKTYPVAIGRPQSLTLSPVGEWRIIQKDMNWGGGFGTRWLGLNVPWGIYGIHGTNQPWSIGTRASAGCIRMFNHDVEELYEWVPAGTPVAIVGAGHDVPLNRPLRSGTTGKDVVVVQLELQRLGFNAQGADGRYGPNTETAVKELQKLYGLPIDGIVYEDVFYVLGLK